MKLRRTRLVRREIEDNFWVSFMDIGYFESLFGAIKDLMWSGRDCWYLMLQENQLIEHEIIGEESQILTNQKRESTVLSVLIGRNLRPFPDNFVLYNSVN